MEPKVIRRKFLIIKSHRHPKGLINRTPHITYGDIHHILKQQTNQLKLIRYEKISYYPDYPVDDYFG